MRVTVKHFAQLKKAGDPATRVVDLLQDGAVDDLLSILDLKKEEVGILIVNGKEAIWGQTLKENDVVTLLPHIGGG
jgi:molybdopterin converting factor small subunit